MLNDARFDLDLTARELGPSSALGGGSAIAGQGDDAVLVPDAQLLFNADFHRAGQDLVLTGEDGRTFTIYDYFNGERRPSLATDNGASLAGVVVEALAGPANAGEYAQAAATAAATAPIGRVEKVSGSATVIRNGVSITLNVGDAVLKGDVVQTGRDSSLGISFIDGTAFALASSARMVLNELVYDPNGTANSALISLVEGTISFVAGKVAKTGDMRVETPVATMGIRGTAVLVTIESTNGVVTAKHSVLIEKNEQGGEYTGSFNVYDKGTGALIGTVSQAGTWFSVASTGFKEFSTKTQEDIRVEQQVVAQAFSVAQIAQQIVVDVQKANDPTKPPADGVKAGGPTSSSNNPTATGDGSKGTPLGDQTPAPIKVVDATANPASPVTTTVTPATPPPADAPVVTKVTIEEAPANVAPTIAPLVALAADLAGVDAGRLVKSGSLLAGATDADGDALSVTTTGLRQGSYGTLSIQSDGQYTYTAKAAFDGLKSGESGTDTFTYSVADGQGHSVSNTLTVTVIGANDAPVAAADGASVVGGQTVQAATRAQGVLGNDTDPDAGETGSLAVSAVRAGSIGSASIVSSGSATVVDGVHGHLTIDADGAYSYQADHVTGLAQGQQGSDVFTYTVMDADGLSSSATLTIAVTGGNSAPTLAGGVTSQNATANAVANGGFETGTFSGWTLSGFLDHTSVSGPGHEGAFSGKFGQVGGIGYLTQNIQTVAGQHYGLSFWLANDGGAPSSFSASWNGGTVIGSALTNSGAQGFTQYSFDVVGVSGSSVLQFAFRQDPAYWHIDDIFVSGGATGPLVANGSVAFADADLSDTHTASFVPVSGTGYIGTFSLDASVAESGGSGSVGWHFSVDQAAIPPGSTALVQDYDVTISDGHGGSVTQRVTVTIDPPQTPVNLTPSFGGDRAITVAEGGAYTLTSADLAAIDDNAAGELTYTVNSQHGSFAIGSATVTSFTQAQVDAGLVTYRHDGSETPGDGFTIGLSDGTSNASGSFSITVTPVNDAPSVSAAVAASGAEGSGTFAINLLQYASDPDSPALHVANLVWDEVPGSLPAGFTLSSDGNSIAVDPDGAAYDGLAAGGSFATHYSYDVADAQGGLTHQTATITIAGRNDAPSLGGDRAFTVSEGGTYTLSSADLAAVDPDNAASQLTYAVSAQHGSFTVGSATVTSFTQAQVNAGQVTYHHDGSETTSDSVSIALDDGTSFLPANSVTIAVTPVNDAPVASNASFSTPGDAPFSASLPTASDAELDPISYALVSSTSGASGTVTLSGSTFTYTPDAGFTGTDSFDYAVSDDHGGSNTYTVSIDVGQPTPTAPHFISPPVSLSLVETDDSLTASGSFTFSAAGAVTAISATAPVVTQYASQVLDFSSQWSTGAWSAAMALGAPDTTGYGDISSAWAPLPRNGPPTDPAAVVLETLSIGFATPVHSTGAVITESYGNGAVTRIDAIDTSGIAHTVWTGTDPTLPGAVRDFHPTWAATSYLTAGLKIYVDINHDQAAWEEIDAVKLEGSPLGATETAALADALTLDPDGRWQVDLASPDYLAQGAVLTATVAVTASNALGSETQTLSVTLTGTNDAPAITESGAVTASLSSGDTAGSLHATDPDAGDTLTWTVVDPSGIQPTVQPHAPAYSFRINEFSVTGSTGVSFHDTFDSATPSGPAYGMTGSYTEANGFGILDAAGGATVNSLNGSSLFHGQYVSLLTPLSTGSGSLSKGSTFSVTGDFDLIQPDDLLEDYGIRLNDSYGQTGDDRLQLVVRKGATGEYRVQFRDSDPSAGATTNIQSFVLNPVNGENEIRLHLDHVANSNDITASYELGVRDGQGNVVWSPTISFTRVGHIFTGENWTRAQFFAETPEPSQSYITGQYGTLSVSGLGAWNYSADNRAATLGDGESAVENFQIKVADSHGGFDTRDVEVTVVGENDAPRAFNDAVTASAGAASGNVLSNDTDVDANDQLGVILVRTGAEGGSGSVGVVGVALQGAFGTLTLNPDGSFAYAVTASTLGANSVDSFTYRIADGHGGFDLATLSISVPAMQATLVEAGFASDGSPVPGVSHSTATVVAPFGSTLTLPYGIAPVVYGGHYYAFIPFNPESSKLSWTESQAQAVSMGGYLASITSAGENTFIHDNLLVPVDHVPPGAVAFMGATDRGHEANWQWSGGAEADQTFWLNGSATTYASWRTSSGEPNNSGDDENFGALESTGDWNDVSDRYGSANGYIVEFDTAPGKQFQIGTYGYAALNTTTGQLDYTLDNNDGDTQGLRIGQAATEAFLVEIATPAGTGSTTQTVTFSLTGANDPTNVLSQIPDYSFNSGPFGLNLVGYFLDPDNEDLSLSATLQGGAPLPSWMAVDNIGISGAPQGPADFGDFTIVLTASDGHGGSASQTFALHVDPASDDQPLVVTVPDAVSGFTNGSFAMGVDPGAAHVVSGGQTDIAGWEVPNSYAVRYVGTEWDSSDGDGRSIDVDHGRLTQTFATTPGVTYTLTFDFSADPSISAIHELQIYVDDATQHQEYFFNTSATTTSDMHWTPQTFQFVALGSETTLGFSSLGQVSSPAIDNLHLSGPSNERTIFEPASYASPQAHVLDGVIKFSDPDSDVSSSVVSQSVSYVTNSNAALTYDEIGAIKDAFSFEQNGTNTGTVDWHYAIDDDRLDFLAEGAVVRLVSTIEIATGTEFVSTDVVIDIVGHNDQPTAEPIDPFSTDAYVPFTLPAAGYFHDADAGDHLTYGITATSGGANPYPWLSIDSSSGVVSGAAPPGEYDVDVTATDPYMAAIVTQLHITSTSMGV